MLKKLFNFGYRERRYDRCELRSRRLVQICSTIDVLTYRRFLSKYTESLKLVSTSIRNHQIIVEGSGWITRFSSYAPQQPQSSYNIPCSYVDGVYVLVSLNTVHMTFDFQRIYRLESVSLHHQFVNDLDMWHIIFALRLLRE